MEKHEIDYPRTIDLIWAMAAPDLILEKFRGETRTINSDDFAKQTRFASMMKTIWGDPLCPSKRYLRYLLKIFIADQVSDDNFESEILMELLNATMQEKLPPEGTEDCCYVGFAVPTHGTSSLLKIRIFPKHNDVALRIWEAGAYLAEYLVSQPGLTANRTIVELGAGTAVTGILLAGLANSKRIICTDFTAESLANMIHNIQLNEQWLCHATKQHPKNRGQDIITSRYLEWNDFGNSYHSSAQRSLKSPSIYSEIDGCDTLLAADVIYDPLAVPSLVRTIRRFMEYSDTDADGTESRPEKKAYIATTKRNEATFELLMRELEQNEFSKQLLVSGKDCDSIPVLVPMRFHQPRSDILIYCLTLNLGDRAGYLEV